jgi:Acetyltransferase (GNAT) domain
VKNGIRKLVYYYGKEGIDGLLRKIGGFVRQRVWSQTRWRVYEMHLGGALTPGAGRLLRREIGLRELVESLHAKACAFPESTSQRLEAGQICHGFYQGARLTTVGWSSIAYLELDEDIRVPCPGCVGFFDFITFDEFRSRGYYTEALLLLIAEMQQRGFGRALIAVDPGNAPSIRGIERAGFTPTFLVMRKWRLGVRYILRQALEPTRKGRNEDS